MAWCSLDTVIQTGKLVCFVFLHKTHHLTMIEELEQIPSTGYSTQSKFHLISSLPGLLMICVTRDT